MVRKDYVEIAEIIGEYTHVHDKCGPIMLKWELVQQLCQLFSQNDSSFEADMFRLACVSPEAISG